MSQLCSSTLRLAALFSFFVGVVAAGAVAATNEITQPFQGIRLIHSRSTVPRLVDMYIAEIDLSSPALSFLVSPSNGALPGDSTPQFTRDFVEQVGAQVGINGNFYNFASGGQLDALGLVVSNGDAYSPFDSGFVDALNISPDKVATIIRATGRGGTAHTPVTTLFTAVSGNTRLVIDGSKTTANSPAEPRTAVGVTADGKPLLFTVDGRNTPHSNGLTYAEMADVLVRWGARNAINLDGGSSTTFVMDDPRTTANDPTVRNVPSNTFANGQPGEESAVSTNLAVFAAPQTAPSTNTFVFADFEQGDEGTFNAPLAGSARTRGVNTSLTSADPMIGNAFDGNWSQQLTIKNDPGTDGGQENPGGAWFVDELSGLGDPANNISRPAIGSVGFWAKTANSDLRMSLVLDDENRNTGDRAVPQSLIADGQWHPYFWNLNDSSQWAAWGAGDGLIGERFTLHSIQIFGPPTTNPNQDAVIYLDSVSHIMPAAVPEINWQGVLAVVSMICASLRSVPRRRKDPLKVVGTLRVP